MKTTLFAPLLPFALAPALLAQFPLPNAGVPTEIFGSVARGYAEIGKRQDVVAVSFRLALLSNGNVIDPYSPQTVLMAGATAIAGTDDGFIAIKAGKIAVGGIAPSPLLTPPASVAALSDVIAIACDAIVGVAQRSTGEAIAWSGATTRSFATSPGRGIAVQQYSRRIVAGGNVYNMFDNRIEAEPFDPGRHYGKFVTFRDGIHNSTRPPVSTSRGPIALGFGTLNEATFTLLNGAIERRESFQNFRTEVGTILTGALGLFQAAGSSVVAILKPNELSLKDGERPLVTTPVALAAAARHVMRAPLAAAVNALENSSAVFFGRVAVGMTSAAHQRTLTITNEGAGTLTLGAVTVTGAATSDFVPTLPAVSTLGPNETATFTVQFTPGAAGQRTATLHLASDDVDETSFDVELNGFGQSDNAAPLAVLDSLTAPAGGGVTFTRLLGNDSDADGDPVKLVSVAAIDGTTQGSVRLQDDDTVAYNSTPEVGTDSFAYTITDGTVTQTGTVNVNVVDPVPLAAGKTFRGAEDGDTAQVTFGKLTPAAAAARLAVRTRKAAALATSGPKLAATFTEVLDGRTYRGRVVFDADDNDGEAVLNGGADNVVANFAMTVDEDGDPRVFADGIELLPDLYDARHPAPPALVGTYTMALPGASLGEFALGVGDSVASVILRKDGVVALRGFMADGQSFTGSAQLGAGNVAPFNIPLYAGRVHGRFTGDLVFDPANAEGSLTGRATWRKPPGIRGLPMNDGFVASGDLLGGFYSPDELPATLAFTFSFGEDGEFTDFLATGAGTLASRFSLTGTLADSTAFTLASRFARSTGLMTGARPARATTEPLKFTGAILQEQEVIAGSAVFLDPGLPDRGLDAEQFTAPVTAPFTP